MLPLGTGSRFVLPLIKESWFAAVGGSELI